MIRDSRLGRLALGLLVLLAGSASVPASDIYVLTHDAPGSNVSSTNFGKINSATGVYTSIASLSTSVLNLAWNPTASNFLTTAGIGSGTTLRTLTTTGTLSASLGAIGSDMYAMAYRTTNSTLYGYDYTNDQTGTINPANASWSTLNTNPGVYSYGALGGRSSIMNDTMYIVGTITSVGIGTIGYSASSTYQQITTDAVYANMVLANDGTTMYGLSGNGTAGQQRLYTIDVVTGAATAGPFITGTGLGTYFHGAGIIPVPEPSTYALGVIATGVMAAVARRRKALKG